MYLTIGSVALRLYNAVQFGTAFHDFLSVETNATHIIDWKINIFSISQI